MKQLIGHHDCRCTGTDGLYRCGHIPCLKHSIYKDIHQNENPTPFYNLSISINNTRSSLLYYTKKTNSLIMDLIPEGVDKSKNNKFYYNPKEEISITNNNKFFFRTSNKIMRELNKQFMVVFTIDKNYGLEKEATNIFSSENIRSKVTHHNGSESYWSSTFDKDKNVYGKYSGMVGNPILSCCSNFRSKYDKNEISLGSQKQYNQSFIWSYMKNVKLNDRHTPQDGLLLVRPKKIKSIVFLPKMEDLVLEKLRFTIYKVISLIFKKMGKQI